MRFISKFIFTVLNVVFFVFLTTGAAKACDTPCRVLALHSYHPGFGKTVLAREVLLESFGGGYTLHEEFLDTKRHAPELSFAQMASTLASKIRPGQEPDVVIAFNDNALDFALKHREAIFGGAPIVFSGINSGRRAMGALAGGRATGNVADFSIKATINLARKLNRQPLRRMIAVVDASEASQELNQRLREVEGEIEGLTFERLNLSEMNFGNLVERLAALHAEDSALLFLHAFRDGKGAVKSHTEMFDYLLQHGRRPVYGLDEVAMRAGATGGYILSSLNQARHAQDVAKRIMSGTPASLIAPQMSTVNHAALNERQARQFRLRAEELPADTEIFDRVAGFWRRNLQGVLIAAAAMLAISTVLAAFLAVNARHRRRLSAFNKTLSQRNEDLNQAKQRIEHQSLHDALTGLPNRRYLERKLKELEETKVEAQTEAQTEAGLEVGGAAGVVALLHFDIDRFKQINDTQGHAAGDQVLVSFAESLKKASPQDGFVARIGGDEFLMLSRFSDNAAARAFFDSLQTLLRKTVRFEGREVRVGASFGAALAVSGQVEAAKLFQRADFALYRAKSEGRNRYALFSDEMHLQLVSNNALAGEIERGLADGEFEPFFQPQVCTRTGAVVAMEALARWRHPTRGLIGPPVFLQVAEMMGVVAEIDHQILTKGARQLSDWRAKGLILPRLSVNVSARRLKEERFLETVQTLNFGETQLCVELLETIFLDHADDALLWVLDRLRELGVGIDIDDFGTGHASVAALLSMRPDRLKIARELTEAIDVRPERLELLRSLVDIGRSLHIHVTAEGVERVEQARLLNKLGCDVLQGHLIGKPAAAAEAQVYLSQSVAADWLATDDAVQGRLALA